MDTNKNVANTIFMRKILDRFNVRLLALSLGAAALIAGSALAVSHTDTAKPKAPDASAKLEVDESPVPRAAGPYTSFAPIVKKVAPGVVKVVVTSKVANVAVPEGFGPNDPFWRHFFGDQSGRQMPNRQLNTPRQHGLGSGVDRKSTRLNSSHLGISH